MNSRILQKIISFLFFSLLLPPVPGFISFSAPLFGQQLLNNLNTSWSNVLPGVVITKPAQTSYGFCVITDARTISSFSNKGQLLWEKPVGRSKKIKITGLPGDFISLIDNSDKENSIFKILNPSGGEIWSKKLDYSVSQEPFVGRDGRFFLKGENSEKNLIECYGMNGICKWRLETEAQKDMALQELPDGSLVVFLSELGGKTRGLRFSPFGEELEEILFAGQIQNAFTCDWGILLTFTDGSSGLFTVNKGQAVNKWTIPQKSTSPFFAVTDDKSDFLHLDLLSDGVIVNEIDKNSGQITHSVKIQGIDGKNIKKISLSDQGLFLCDQKSACLYNKNGNEVWSAKIPYTKNKEIWNYLIYTDDNYLIFCQKDWTLNAYHVTSSKKSVIGKNNKTFKKSYSDFIKINPDKYSLLYTDSFGNDLISEERISSLKNGFYGKNEEEWASQILSICQLYFSDISTSNFGTRIEKSIFDLDSAGFEKILIQLLLLGTADSQNTAASILSKTTNKSYIKAILTGISENAYDPDGNLLSALAFTADKVDYKENSLINSICDAVYSICLFMGRPAYNSQGKDILKNFLYPNYSTKTRTYARDTLKKIMTLDL